MKQSKEFYAGYMDYGYGKTTNPYDEGTEQYEEWQLGYDMAEDDSTAMEHVRKYARHRIQRGSLASDFE